MTKRLRHCVAVRVEPSTEVRPLVTLDQIEPGTGRLSSELVESAPNGQIRFEPGDVLFSKLRPYLAKSLLVTVPAHGTGELLALRPRESVLDSRYLHYLMHSQPWLELATLTSYGTKMPRTSWEALCEFVIPVVEVSEQRRIADFLDDQTTRIDNIIAARQRQRASLSEVLQSEVDATFDVAGRDFVRLSRWIKVLPGWAFPSERFSQDASDVRLLRGVNVGVGELRWDETVYWSRDSLGHVRSFVLSAGDLVIGMDRPWIGAGTRIARVSSQDLPCLLLQRVAKIVPGTQSQLGFLYWAYQAGSFRQSVESELTGLSVPHLSAGQIASHVVPALDAQEQSDAARRLDNLADFVGRARASLDASVALLQEFKRSLISAAVSGEFDVSTASGRGVPA